MGADQRKQQSPASLAFVRGIHRGPVNSPHKWPLTRKMFPFDDVIINMMIILLSIRRLTLRWTTHGKYLFPLRVASDLVFADLASSVSQWPRRWDLKDEVPDTESLRPWTSVYGTKDNMLNEFRVPSAVFQLFFGFRVLWKLHVIHSACPGFETTRGRLSYIVIHCCIWPGDARSQVINSNGMDIIFPAYSGLGNRRIRLVNVNRTLQCSMSYQAYVQFLIGCSVIFHSDKNIDAMDHNIFNNSIKLWNKICLYGTQFRLTWWLSDMLLLFQLTEVNMRFLVRFIVTCKTRGWIQHTGT